MNKDLVTVIAIIVGVLAMCLFGTAAILAFKVAGAAYQAFLVVGGLLCAAWGSVLYDKYL